MIENAEKAVLSGHFKDWLAETDCNTCHYKAGIYPITVIRVEKNEDFDYLYCQRQYGDAEVNRGNNFEYVGLYCRRDGLVYDGQFAIRELADGPGDFESRSAEVLSNCLRITVRSSVESAIQNDRKNLHITEISDTIRLKRLEDFPKYSAAGMAREYYLNSESDAYTVVYRCPYKPSNWTEDSLLDYISDPIGYIASEKAAYIASHQEEILEDFLKSDMVAAAYAEILANPLSPIHRVKRIMKAMEASPAKTVNVTIRKDGIKFTFKAEAEQFRHDCASSYGDWHIAAADRRKFERRFGRNTNYTPEDIIRIDYARSTLYQVEVASA